MILTTAIEEIWPHLDPAQTVRVNRLISRAESIILQRFPTVPKRIAEGELSQQVVEGHPRYRARCSRRHGQARIPRGFHGMG